MNEQRATYLHLGARWAKAQRVTAGNAVPVRSIQLLGTGLHPLGDRAYWEGGAVILAVTSSYHTLPLAKLLSPQLPQLDPYCPSTGEPPRFHPSLPDHVAECIHSTE